MPHCDSPHWSWTNYTLTPTTSICKTLLECLSNIFQPTKLSDWEEVFAKWAIFSFFQWFWNFQWAISYHSTQIFMGHFPKLMGLWSIAPCLPNHCKLTPTYPDISLTHHVWVPHWYRLHNRGESSSPASNPRYFQKISKPDRFFGTEFVIKSVSIPIAIFSYTM